VAYVDVSEIQRVLGKTTPTADELDAMNRCNEAAAAEIDWDLGYTAGSPAPSPPSPIVVDVNLQRACELWRLDFATVGGALLAGPESVPLWPNRDTWFRHSVRLNPLRTAWGVG
jgi:hypothetical protein